MKNSDCLNNEIYRLKEAGEDFKTGRLDFGFERGQDEDLYYSVQNVNLWISGTYIGENKWNITVRMTDVYDFTEFRGGLSFANIANNLGEAMQRNEMMTPFKTEIEYTYVWEREKK